MGQWTITEVYGLFRPMAVGNDLGHTFMVTIRFRHTAAPDGPCVEMPQLVWREKILHKDYNTMKFWEWGAVEGTTPQEELSGNLYQYNPDAATFRAWRERYLLAYQNANGEQPDTQFGDCQLTVRGTPVTIHEIQAAVAPPAPASRSRVPSFMQPRDRTPQPAKAVNSTPISTEAKAKAVRSFIRQNDCELRIDIIDRPRLSNVQSSGNGHSRNVERLVLFNCGVAGRTIRAHQLLRTHSPEGKHSPKIHFALNWPYPATLPLDGFLPDFDNITNYQYEHRLLSAAGIGNHALSFEPDGYLGFGEYR